MATSKGRRYNYEAMFLVSPADAADLGGVVEHIKETIARGEGELISLKKWDERRLAFEIKKNKRGVYFLAYFACDPVNIDVIERACNLSERILRVMFTRADHLTLEEMQAADGQADLAAEAQLRRTEAESQERAEASA
jgi:small subunit ribosomal protein S6